MKMLFVLFSIFIGAAALANNPGVSYQGRIFKPDGTALEGTAVQFRMQVRSPGSENCLLYEEVQTLNMAGSAGVFSLTMNDGTGTRLDSPTYQVDRIFANRGTMTLDTSRCATGTDYTPNSSDGRKLVVYFKDETMAAYEAMPIMNLNYVPQSMYALESQKVGTFAVTNILRAVDGSGNPAAAPALDPTQLTNLTNLLAGTSTQYATAAQFSTIQTFATTAPPTCGPSEVLKSNGTVLSCVTDSAGGAPAYSAITAASAANTIDNTNFAQTWNWSTATTQSPMSMSANALTTGSAMNVTTSSASLNSTNGLLNVANTGASTNGILARFQSNSTAGSGLTVLTNGNVGIGTTNPTTSLLVSKDQAGDTQIAVENRNTTASTGSASISFRGYRDVETDYELAKIRMQPSASGMGGNLAHNGSLIFYTGGYDAGGGGGWAKPRMKIDWAGNVGINTTTPQAFLDIAVPSSDTTNSASIILSTHASTYASPALYLLGTRPNFTSKYGDTGVDGWKLSSISGNGGTGGMEDDATFCFRTGTAAENCLMHFDGSSRNINIGGTNSSLHSGSRLNVMGNMTVGGTWSTYSTQKAAPANSLIVEGMIGAATDIPTSALDINGALTQRGMAAPALSPTGQGRIYFDSSSNTFKVSQNGSG